MFFCVYLVLISSGYAAVSDHLEEVEIWQAINYNSPESADDTQYEFEFMATTDDTVEYIAVQCPGGKGFTITKNDGHGTNEETHYSYDPGEGAEWEFFAEYPNSDLTILDQYGEGDYIVTIYYSAGGSEQTTISYLNIPQVTEVPIFTSPMNNASFDSGEPVTFTWDTNSIDTNTNAIAILLEQYNESEELEIERIYPDPPPGPPFPASDTFDTLTDGLWRVEFLFANFIQGTNAGGVAYLLGKTSASEYVITVGPLHTLSGQVTYSGHKTGVLRVDFHAADSLNPNTSEWLHGIIATGSTSPWTYSFDLPANRPYYVNAYLDLTNNGWDSKDPNAWYHEQNEWRSSILLDADKSGIDIILPAEQPKPVSAINLLLLTEE
jgi:hypothetical protein